MSKQTPEFVEIDREQLDGLLKRLEEKLDPEDSQLLRLVVQAYIFLLQLVKIKSTTIGRLRKMLFGAKTEKTSKVAGGSDTSSSKGESQQESGDSPDKPPKGHGRNSAEAYSGAAHVEVPHDHLQPGDPCPKCGSGTLYNSCPGVLVRITGQAPLSATVYRVQKLRCQSCGKIFTASLPAHVGDEKYDASSAAMIALLKYGSGLPFNRLAGLQESLGVPLPASTQWDVLSAFFSGPKAAFEELIRQAAQGAVLHNDDTTIKILQLMKENAGRDNEDQSKSRTGMFTSGVVAITGGMRIALFFSGRQHAGENLADVLAHRASGLSAPIQMCDALSHNIPGELETILANCLTHARREFTDIYDCFPDECDHVLQAFRVIYYNDKVARERAFRSGASGVSPAGKRTDDERVQEVARPANRREAGGAEFGPRQGNRLFAQALAGANLVPSCGGRAIGQQHL